MLIDGVVERKDWMDEIALNLEGFTTYCVKVHCSLEELDRREKARGDRKVGLATWQSGIVHNFIGYDLEIDTQKESTGESAEKLKKLFYSGVEPEAFNAYRQKLRPNLHAT